MIVDFIPNIGDGGSVSSSNNSMSHMDYWSEVEELLTITNTAADATLPAVTVAGLPSSATVRRVTAMLKYRAVEDTSAAANSLVLAGTEHIQVDKTGSTFIDAIKLVAGMVQVAASTRDGGDVWVGDIDIAAEVNSNDTYEFRWEGADVTGNNLLLRDLQTGLRVYFS